MNRDGENLRELLGRFYGPDEAAQIEQDLDWGDRTMAQWPVQEPQAEVVERTKAEISRRLKHRGRSPRIAWAAALSAVAVVAVGIWLALLGPGERDVPPAKPLVISPHAWDIDTEMDAELAEVTSELDELMDSMLDLQLDEYHGGDDNLFEMLDGDGEAVAATDDFWEG